MRFALYLPTYAWPDLGFEQAGRMRDFGRKAEALGFDALWVCEHFLVAPGLYGAVWMSPLLCLSHAAAVTRRIRPDPCSLSPERKGEVGARGRLPGRLGRAPPGTGHT